MPHFYLDDEIYKISFQHFNMSNFLSKVSEFVKLFNAITLMHYMTKKRKHCTYCVTKDALYSTLVKIELQEE